MLNYVKYSITEKRCIVKKGSSGNRQEMSDLFEAFFRYKFENNYSGAQQGAEGYFLQIEGKDPSPEFNGTFCRTLTTRKKGSGICIGVGNDST